MIIGNNYEGYSHRDFAEEELSSLEKRLEPASPEEFLKWVRESIRVGRQRLQQLEIEHRTLLTKADHATVNLKRLQEFAKFGEKFNLNRIEDVHRQIMHDTNGLGQILVRCNEIITDTTMNQQFVGETLKQKLADRHKKIAVQKELGLRLRDLDRCLERSEAIVKQQKESMENLQRSIRKLLTRLKVKLPPAEREKVDREDKVAQIARRYSVKIAKPTPEDRRVARNLGQIEEVSAPAPAPMELVEESSTVLNLAMLAVGAGLGYLLLHKYVG